jgi:hypothetical protein
MEEKFPHYLTPVSTIVKAYNMFLDDDSLSGKVAECVIENIYFRDCHPVTLLILTFID